MLGDIKITLNNGTEVARTKFFGIAYMLAESCLREGHLEVRMDYEYGYDVFSQKKRPPFETYVASWFREYEKDKE